MKFKLIIFLFLLSTVSGHCFGISIYEIQYQFQISNQTDNYTAFLVRYGDGTGFMRVLYKNNNAQQSKIVNMDFVEILKSDSDPTINDVLLFDTRNPHMIKGTDNYNPDQLFFRKNSTGIEFSPWKVSSFDVATNKNIVGNIIAVKLLNASDLTEDYAARFFNKNEAFYVNLLKNLNTLNNNPPQQAHQLPTVAPAAAASSLPILHLIIIGNTNDLKIGASCAVDVKNIKNEFCDIASLLNVTILYTEITGIDFSKANIVSTIKSLKPDKNDIVVFCYTGHGFSYAHDNYSAYPQLDLTRRRTDDVDENTLNVNDIYNSIVSKGARLNIVISDCCNSDIGVCRPFGNNYALTSKSYVGWVKSYCDNLFLNTKANILASAAQKGEFAYCNNDIGGYFTWSFLNSLEKHLSKFNTSQPDWNTIFSDSYNATLNLSRQNSCAWNNCRQDIAYYIKK